VTCGYRGGRGRRRAGARQDGGSGRPSVRRGPVGGVERQVPGGAVPALPHPHVRMPGQGVVGIRGCPLVFRSVATDLWWTICSRIGGHTVHPLGETLPVRGPARQNRVRGLLIHPPVGGPRRPGPRPARHRGIRCARKGLCPSARPGGHRSRPGAALPGGRYDSDRGEVGPWSVGTVALPGIDPDAGLSMITGPLTMCELTEVVATRRCGR
jgi:hypothetical protein